MITLVTEGAAEEFLWRTLLDGLGHDDVRVVGAGGRSAAITKANTILVTRGEPVALVLDADTNDRRLLETEREATRFSMQFGADAVPSEVFLVAPTMEAMFFIDRVIETVIGRPLSEVERVRAEYDPKRVLHDILPGALRQNAVSVLRDRVAGSADPTQLPYVGPVVAFLERCREPVASAS